MIGGSSAGIIQPPQPINVDLPDMLMCNLKDMILAPLTGILGSKPSEAGGKKDP